MNTHFELRDPKEAHDKLNLARKQLKEGLSDIREVVRTLDSGALISTEGSLKAAIEHLARDTEIQTGISTRLHFDLTDKLLSLQEHVLLNAVKEGITNAVRHAGPSWIDISLTQSDSQAVLTIQNDGKGCKAAGEGFGLKAIKENAEAIGGEVKYESTPEGFTLNLHVPMISEE
jgi:signal transduction histidine kinase